MCEELWLRRSRPGKTCCIRRKVFQVNVVWAEIVFVFLPNYNMICSQQHRKFQTLRVKLSTTLNIM
jgi:hypothetical protein